MRILLLFFLLIGFLSCSNRERLQSEIQSLEDELYSQSIMDTAEASTLIERYQNYIKEYPLDIKSYNYALSTAKMYSILGQYSVAVDQYKHLLSAHEDFPQRPETIFMLAFAYETLLLELDSATTYYKFFIKEYPNHDLADDARFSLEYMHIPDEELIQMFELKRMLEEMDTTKQES